MRTLIVSDNSSRKSLDILGRLGDSEEEIVVGLTMRESVNLALREIYKMLNAFVSFPENYKEYQKLQKPKSCFINSHKNYRRARDSFKEINF